MQPLRSWRGRLQLRPAGRSIQDASERWEGGCNWHSCLRIASKVHGPGWQGESRQNLRAPFHSRRACWTYFMSTVYPRGQMRVEEILAACWRGGDIRVQVPRESPFIIIKCSALAVMTSISMIVDTCSTCRHGRESSRGGCKSSWWIPLDRAPWMQGLGWRGHAGTFPMPTQINYDSMNATKYSSFHKSDNTRFAILSSRRRLFRCTTDRLNLIIHSSSPHSQQ